MDFGWMELQQHYLHLTKQYHMPRIFLASIKGEILIMFKKYIWICYLGTQTYTQTCK